MKTGAIAKSIFSLGTMYLDESFPEGTDSTQRVRMGYNLIENAAALGFYKAELFLKENV